MRRREFLGLIGGTAAWPRASGAQPWEPRRRVGILTGYIENDAEARRRLGAFGKKLKELGWIEDQNIKLDYRYGAADAGRIQAAASELIELRPSVILTAGTPATMVVRSKTKVIPIVFTQVDDPVGAGLVPSLARPGENVTGFTPFELSIGPKMLEVLKTIAPRISRALFVMSPDSTFHSRSAQALEAVAPSLGVQFKSAAARDISTLERGIRGFAEQADSGLIVPSYTLANVHRDRIIALANDHRMPAIYAFRHYVEAGGLVSYGIDPAEQFRDAASYVDRILKGEKPADLPIQAPSRFEMVINRKTARTLGLEIPPKFLFTADEVIE